MALNKILTSGNLRLLVTNLFGAGKLRPHDTLEGIPIGTANGSPTGELGVKVIIIGGASGSSTQGMVVPNSDYVGYTYYGATNNIQTATYKIGGAGGTIVGTLTYTYIGSATANNDNISSVTRS